MDLSEEEITQLKKCIETSTEFNKSYKQIFKNHIELVRAYCLAGSELSSAIWVIKDEQLKTKLSNLLNEEKDFATIALLLHRYDKGHHSKAFYEDKLLTLALENRNMLKLIQLYASVTTQNTDEFELL